MDQASADPQVIGLDDGDELLWAGVSPGGGEFLLVTAQGQAIRFAEDDVRSMGLPAGGIGGVKLAAKDRVVAAMVIAAMALVKGESAQPHVVLITTLGIGKRVPVADFPAQGRNGQGVVAAKPSPKLGNVAGAALAGPSDTLLCLTAGGGARPIPAAAVPEMGRPAQGKSVIPLVGGDQVTRIVGVAVEQSRGKAEVEVKVEAKAEARLRQRREKPPPAPPKLRQRRRRSRPSSRHPGRRLLRRLRSVPRSVPRPKWGRQLLERPRHHRRLPRRRATRKAAAAQPTLLPSEQATPAPKQPAKPAAAPQTEPAAKPTGRSAAKPTSTAPTAEPAKPTSRSTAKNASTVTKTEPIKPAARSTTKPADDRAQNGRSTSSGPTARQEASPLRRPRNPLPSRLRRRRPEVRQPNRQPARRQGRPPRANDADSAII